MKIWIVALAVAALLVGACGDDTSADKGDSVSKEATTASGLRYVDEQVGTGDAIAPGQIAVVHYTGWLDDGGKPGKRFDSSRDQNRPFEFKLGAGQVIKGWDEGVQGMKVGGKRRLFIPASLGYGARGAGNVIPPNAALIFDVELLGVK